MASVKKIIAKMKSAPNINSSGDVITIKQESQLKRAYIEDILSRIGE